MRHVRLMYRSLVFIAAAADCLVDALGVHARLSANPIRRVVTMLEAMKEKVAEEAATSDKIFEDFECKCKKGYASVKKSMEEASIQIPQLQSSIEQSTAEKEQLTSSIAEAKTGREDATAAISQATAIREREATAAAKEISDFKTNIAAMDKAIKALEDGLSGSFLQSPDAAVLRHLLLSGDVAGPDLDMATSFLSQGQGDDQEEDVSAPSTGEVVGLLEQMQETMKKDLATAESDEAASLASHEQLVAAKKREIAALTQEIESKSSRAAELGVEIVNFQEDLEDTEASISEGKSFLVEHAAQYMKRAAKHDEQKKAFNEESVALAEAVETLNNDDALELFKKALPSPSLLQVQVQAKDVLQEAHKLLAVHRHRRDYRLDLISLTLHGKQADFSKVLKMIDDMIALLKDEQTSDETKVADCKRSLEEASDEATSLSHTASDLQKAIDEMMERKASLVDEIATFVSDIESLDKSVVEATSQRKTEHEAYVAEINDNKAAVEIITLAKNRLQKFYNPGLYKEPPTTTSQPGVKFSDLVLVQDSEHKKMAQRKQNSSAVIALIDAILKDMAKEMQEAEFAEKANQEDYETFMEDSKAKRAADSKALEAHESAKADLDARLVKHTDELKSTKVGEMNNAQYTAEVHHDCDWLMQNLAIRKEARADEIDSLEKAKAVLSGADYSFLQTGRSTHKYLRASARQVSRASQIVMKA
mmetsp:Transcript_80896/g.147571  ORF Transcript_80896/g.147571 Transcript_80896/m.147571 type:complete len:708 (-) Transcript_80896:38-2161(-)